MASWLPIRFYYDTMLGSVGSTFTATSTAAGDYLAAYLYNMLEVNMWKASSTDDQTLSYDAGAGNSKAADYIAILGHNLKTAGVNVYVERSSDNINWTEAFSWTPSADTVQLKEFSNPGSFRYWRLKMTGASTAVYMTLCIWGLKTELKFASASFDPHEENAKANMNLSQGGYVTGVHKMYSERRLSLKFENANATIYTAVKAWWDANGLKNFFVAWEIANNPNDVYLMRPDVKFSNPLINSGLRRNITINLIGRKE